MSIPDATPEKSSNSRNDDNASEEAPAGQAMTEEKEATLTGGSDAYTAEKKDARFWLIILTLGITSILVAVDGTIIQTTLPTITDTLGGGTDFIWVSGVFFLAITALQPLYGQLANIFGRRNLLCATVGLFTLGSGICGGASSMNMLIGGRLVQGIGSAGINLLLELIICDLVPLRERGQYTSIIYSAALVGSTLGPWIGGEVIAKSSWRWVFYLNLPIGGTSMVLVIFLLNMNTRSGNPMAAQRRIDVVGNVLFIASTIAFLFGLIYGGVKYPWDSWHVLVPLILGIAGIIAFCAWEASPWCVEPALPKQLVGNRTSVAALVIAFLHMSVLQWVTYFVSVYFQVALHASPARAGVDLFPNMFGFLVSSVLAGVMVTKTGRYRPMQFLGWAIMSVLLGTYSLLKRGTPTAGWVLQVFFNAFGCGFVMPCLLPALQAELTDDDSAAAMAALTIARSFGSVVGTVVPSVIFNNEFDKRAHAIQDRSTRDQLTGGEAYSHATKDYINGLHGATKDQVISVYLQALKLVWYIGLMICLIGFLVVFVEKEVVLRTSLDTEFGVKGKKKKADDAAESGEKGSEQGLSAQS
ncbi:putative MFS-type transporter [Escovopsis weberi]|uniref:Putative MFS-type transporter n=1 Tax=Escovopsis weberi TaxID=150374 RepID=A0A0M8MVP5_ESCWE|nr:putative MFS-type transporter [Escovopsis weberi]